MQKKDDLRSQNDNSREYREKRSKQTEELLKKSLHYIYESDKNFSYKNICVTMGNLAEEKDKKVNAVISPSAISKNKHYKQIIATHKIQNNIFKEKQNKLNLSEGDLAFELHKCKTILAQKYDEVKIFKKIFDNENINMKNRSLNIEIHKFDFKSLLVDAYRYLIKDGAAYIDDESENMITETGSLMATRDLLKELGII